MASINDNANLLKKKKIQYCAYCGAKLTEGTKFCSNCGKPVFVTEENGKKVTSVNMGPEESDVQKEEIPNTKKNASNTYATQVVNDGPVKESSDPNPLPAQSKEKKSVAKCPKCGAELVEGATFCHVCGTPLNQSASKIQPKTEREKTYTGKVIKCPNCGEVLDAFVSTCPSCGYELREVGNSSAVQEFAALVSNTKSDREKINIIRNFPIPNTKEDILEFSILASTNINENQNLDDEVSDAWFAKLQQAYQKAGLSFKDQPEYNRVENIYEQIKDLREKDKKTQQVSKLIRFSPILIGIIVCFIIIIFISVGISRHKEDERRAEEQSIAESEEAAQREEEESRKAFEEEKSIAMASVYEWPSSGNSQYLPKPSFEYGVIETDTDKKFSIAVYHVTEEQFNEYADSCKDKGFIIDEKKTDSRFDAFNEDEYDLDVVYNEEWEEMKVTLTAPEPVSEIHWPDTDLTKQIPEPPSLIGRVSIEWDNYFVVYISNISSEQYDEYVDQCMEMGFTKDYSRTSTRFYGKNKKGYTITVQKERFDKMYISISAPKKLF